MRGIGISVTAAAVFLAILAGPAAAQDSPKVTLSWLELGKVSGGINVTASSGSTQLPSGGDTAWACNTGATNDAYISFGSPPPPATTTGSSWLKAGTCGAYSLRLAGGVLATSVTAITASSTTTLTLETGIGTPPALTSSSGGGGGGGGLSVPFGGAIGANGTPVGLKDPATGFLQPFQGDTTSGLWVNIKQGPLGVAKTAIYTSQTASIVMGLVNASAPTGGSDGTLDFPSLTTARAARTDNYSWAGTALGAPSNYGTSPGTVLVPGVNAFVTNTPAVTQSGNWTARIVGNAGATLDALPGSAPTNALSVQGIASMTPFLDNPGTPANWGIGATAASAPANAVQMGCVGSSADQTVVTNGQLIAPECGLNGRLVVQPYAIKENDVRGTVTTTGAGAATIIAAGTGSNKTYVTGAQCWNTSATAVTITFDDVETTGSGTQLFLPAGGGNNAKFDVPIVTVAATAFTFTPSGAQTTLGCNAQGYYGL